jgi:hypothetical protein
MRSWHALVGGGVVLVLLVVIALASVWRSRKAERFPEPQAGRPRPVQKMENVPVTTPGRLEWDFREGLDRRSMGLMAGGSGDVLCRPTSEGIHCTIPTGPDHKTKYCGVTLNFGLRGDFQITARYKILSLPQGEPGGFPGLKISIWDANDHWAQMVRQHLAADGDVFNVYYKQPGAPHGSVVRRPTSVTAGKLSLRRTGTTLHYLATIDESDELVQLHTFEFPADDVTRIHLAAQTGGSPTGVEMIWHDLQIEADAVLGFAEEGGRTGEQESRGAGEKADR